MAEPRVNLNNYKSSGVYTIEIDASENATLPLTTGRLIIGSSRVGPFNTVVLINDIRTLKAVFGEIDPKLEKAGSYFHRSIEVALREGPVYAMNVLPLDNEADPSSNLDKATFATFNTESASKNAGTTYQYPIVEFFNRQRLWFAESAKLTKSKNTSTNVTVDDKNKVLSFVNLGGNNITTWVKKATVNGFEVTAREWYTSVGASEIEFPSFVHQDDFISDYFVEVITINGDWTNHLKLSKDPIYKSFFSESGLRIEKMSEFFALREVKVINRTVGCLIPDFRDQSGITVSIDRLINNSFPTTGLMCSLDIEKLDTIDLMTNNFLDTITGDFKDDIIAAHRVDIIGHGFDNLSRTISDAGFDSIGDPMTAVKLINTLSYAKPNGNKLVYIVSQVATMPAPTIINSVYWINGGPGNNVVVATEGHNLYNAYINGFIKNGDLVKDGVTTRYIKFTEGQETNAHKYITISAYSDSGLVNQVDLDAYLNGLINYVEFTLSTGDDFKQEFLLTDSSIFSSYSVSQPNVLTVTLDSGITTANKNLFLEYVKVNQYILAKQSSILRPRVLKIISVELTSTNTYKITTMSPSVDEVTGLNVDFNILKVYKGIPNFINTLKGQYLSGFKLRDNLLPNGTPGRVDKEILQYLFDSTNIPAALSNSELIDFRYIVDSYAGTIINGSKEALVKLAAVNGKAMAIVNAPSVQQFEKSVDPSFIDIATKSVSMDYISKGGNLSLNPSFLFSFADGDVNGVPLSSYAMYNFPNFIIRSGSKNISVPQAAYVSNLYVRKFKNGTPFLIVAGGKRGAFNDSEIVGLEYDLTDDDRDYLEPVGFNLTVKRRGFGIILFSNNTAYQRINSALNNAHVRDNLSTIERDIEKILFNFLFDFNDEITRLRVRTIVENYLDAVVNAKGVETYEVIFDASNNGTDVISANAAVIDIRVNFPRGIQKFINRITITRVDGTLSSEATGFVPSF